MRLASFFIAELGFLTVEASELCFDSELELDRGTDLALGNLALLVGCSASSPSGALRLEVMADFLMGISTIKDPYVLDFTRFGTSSLVPARFECSCVREALVENV